MKKKSNFLLTCLALFSVLWLTGCKDEELPFGNEFPVEKGKLSFVLPLGGKKAVTYANVPGEDDEYSIERLRIYWFKDNDSKLFQVFNYGPGLEQTISLSNTSLSHSPDAANPTNSSTIATINVGEDSDASKFYIVANVNGSSITSDALLGVEVGVTTRTDFEALLANELQVDPSATQGELTPIKTPLPMSIRSDGTATLGGFIQVNTPSSAGYVDDIHLKRRVARFDIINSSAYSNFEITNVRIARAQKRGWLHDKPFTGSEAWRSTGNMAIDASSANGPVLTDEELGVDDNHNGILDVFEVGNKYENDTAVVKKAVFYLWPTQLANDGVGTEITLEGKYLGGQPRLYHLNLPSPLDIEANKIYKIKIVRSAESQVRFNLTVDDWEDDDAAEFHTSQLSTTLTNWGTLKGKSLSGDVTLDLSLTTDQTFEFASSLTDSTTITIVNEGTNLTPDSAYNHVSRVIILQKEGTTADVDFVASDLQSMQASRITSTTVLTYGAHYVTTHEIRLAPTDAPIETTLQILDAVNPQDLKTVTLRSNNYGKTGIKPARFGNTLWAPINVGATKRTHPSIALPTGVNDSTYKLSGNYFQWGRNTPFSPSPTTFAAASVTSTQFSTQADANASSLFYTGLDNWLDHHDNELWLGDNAQGPCPPGWHVATDGEFGAMFDPVTTIKTLSNGWWRFTSSLSTDTLYFPQAGFRTTGTTGALSNYAGSTSSYFLVWLANATPSDATPPNAPYRAYSNNNGTVIHTAPGTTDTKAKAYNVRAARTVPLSMQ